MTRTQPIHCPTCAMERGVAIPKHCPHIGERGDTMTHTPCPQCREEHGPRPLSYDGFGINSCGMYRDRIATFSKSVSEAQRKELGALWIAAPAMYEALKAMIAAEQDYFSSAGKGNEAVAVALVRRVKAAMKAEEALRLAEGGKP